VTKKEQTKQQILTASWQLFSEQGYHQTSTRDIAKAANVANGTVFSHFATKVAILKYSFENELTDILSTAESLDTSTTATDRMYHYARFLYAFYLAKKEFSRELFKEIMWQQNELEPQLNAFKKRLINGNDATPTDADIIIDLYFMTLMDGLNHADSSVDSMLATLKIKLAKININ
tara:strand:- start:1004 stop:1531 length:528 start_codon:yes stop_codon:yes gene_type:complete